MAESADLNMNNLTTSSADTHNFLTDPCPQTGEPHTSGILFLSWKTNSIAETIYLEPNEAVNLKAWRGEIALRATNETLRARREAITDQAIIDSLPDVTNDGTFTVKSSANGKARFDFVQDGNQLTYIWGDPITEADKRERAAREVQQETVNESSAAARNWTDSNGELIEALNSACTTG